MQPLHDIGIGLRFTEAENIDQGMQLIQQLQYEESLNF